MKYVIISDIHGNIDALESVLPEIEAEKPDRIICLGDIVGYGAAPSECLNKVRSIADVIISGNHDAGVVGKNSLDNFNPVAKEAIIWTKKQLSEVDLSFLKDLPLIHSENNLLFVHAVPSKPYSWSYIFTLGDAIEEFSFFLFLFCFVGHSHQPGIFYENGDGRHGMNVNSQCEIKSDFRYIINVGSVGQPRDGDPRACFGILDIEGDEGMFEFKRVPYNIEQAQKRILDAGLPEFLAIRLALGR